MTFREWCFSTNMAASPFLRGQNRRSGTGCAGPLSSSFLSVRFVFHYFRLASVPVIALVCRQGNPIHVECCHICEKWTWSCSRLWSDLTCTELASVLLLCCSSSASRRRRRGHVSVAYAVASPSDKKTNTRIWRMSEEPRLLLLQKNALPPVDWDFPRSIHRCSPEC